jgi:glycosyltransferase involved in cell wall biosynthesis
MSKYLVSIAMTTYNGEKYLKEQLDSIYNQTFKNIEVIVCDDCSSDKTIDILQKYNKQYGLKYYINKKNLGYVKNFEKAISLCRGDYIALSDQDDIWNTNKIEVLLANIGDNLLIHSDVSLINETGSSISQTWKNEIHSHKCFEDFLFSNVVTGCTVMFAKALLKEVLPFADGLAYHDWYLAIHAAKHAKIIYLNKPLIQYRQHSTQDTGAVVPNYVSILLFDPIKRLRGKEILRQIGIKKQVKNLLSIQDSIHFSDQEHKSIKDAIAYFNSYLNSFIHFKMFFIGCKYKKYLYRKYNYFCIKNMVRDIIG